jgi:hypothetical protein
VCHLSILPELGEHVPFFWNKFSYFELERGVQKDLGKFDYFGFFTSPFCDVDMIHSLPSIKEAL